MLDLPEPELILFVAVVVLYFAAALVGILQISSGGGRYKPLLTHLFALAVVLEAVILIFRAIAIKAVPLTGLFESMIVLTLVLGLTYLVLGMVIRQVWFASVMTWVILGMILLTAMIAKPAVEPSRFAVQPWVVMHGLAMILGAAMILLAGISAYIYLLAQRRLKQKKILKVIGAVPNLQKLDRIHLFGLKAAFVFVTIGLASGIGGAWVSAERLGNSPLLWMVDSKIIGISAAWLLLVILLTARYLHWIKGRRTAYATIIIFVLTVFAFVGATILCNTKHDFSRTPDEPGTQTREQHQ